MPCKESVITLECNFYMAKQSDLKRKMEQSSDYILEYTTFMNNMFEQKNFERIQIYDIKKPSCYIPYNRSKAATFTQFL